MANKYALSDWELAELAHYRACGWTLFELAHHYGVTTRTVDRILRRMREARKRESGPATADVD